MLFKHFGLGQAQAGLSGSAQENKSSDEKKTFLDQIQKNEQKQTPPARHLAIQKNEQKLSLFVFHRLAGVSLPLANLHCLQWGYHEAKP